MLAPVTTPAPAKIQAPVGLYIWHAYQNWKLVGNEENNIPPPLHTYTRGRHKYRETINITWMTSLQIKM